MNKHTEYDKRCNAIQYYEKGIPFERILDLVRRGRFWLAKWLRRYKEHGLEGLRDRSRAPNKIWRRTPQSMVKTILSLREELESHRTKRSAFSGIGPEVISWELKQRHVRHVPSLSTIARILCRHGKTGKKRPKADRVKEPYPSFKPQKIGELHQTDLVGPRFLRGPNGITRFYSFHTVDVAGHTASANQFPDKRTISLCNHLIESWSFMGLPRISQMDNEMSATGGGRYPYSLSQVMRLHLFLGIHLVFIPQGEPGRNASVESFNALWQDRVLRRHNCPTLAQLRKTTEHFLRYYHYEKPHRALSQEEHGTRFSGLLRDHRWGSLRHLPRGFSLQRYVDSAGHLSIPIAKGKISYIRKVDSHGKIELNGSTYFIQKKLEGQYVVGTIYTHRKRLVVKQGARVIKSFTFPIKGSIVDPMLRTPNKKNK
jgi:putative transposase